MSVRPDDPSALEFLRHGRIEVEGRLVAASNATLYCAIEHEGVSGHCVYKPVRGEQPLWDFPDGTLAGREVATYLISAAAGWDLVPPTVLRPGPFGPGMVQLWIDTDTDAELVDVTGPAEVPSGWRPVLQAHDRAGEPAVLAHADHPRLKTMAVLDAVVNNADRKGGHVLSTAEGEVFAVDHGICLNTQDKLRTVLWGWIGQGLGAEALETLGSLRAQLAGGLGDALHDHLTRKEVAALGDRIDRLAAAGVFPSPSDEWPAIPWPAF
ncbi:putative repeat protein (TIGR03843 family) [Actinoalloteichus hymeniacidonis]|uniref:Phosphatidylinositol 3-and 4-kinase n=1 Tax=Actinoalloteichus hymeniacidonis TaxID=340345 RepID=A0AAC9HR45_9PSEU|nr:SCO1664 family protein [Actinoalloteichus hymeniacidonis]AOS63441.1 hypothetical protein TL08_13135 [Actinoalloteichus hymeniacidonis]MBB5908517.1 putative repeat protein (TIGR03843 family) [Actinoalloteichus hymeniacidonis]